MAVLEKNIWGQCQKVGDLFIIFSRRPQNTRHIRHIVLNELLRPPKCSFPAAVTNIWGQG